ncbi:hypothetical protein [Flavobacterium ajazii]|uniref:hypothetical protein n=1 Tax=Flavobacterium ajazii TaxID=2692318 RepID=UPI0013D4D043|nr:hypothetical protein [Flavobacterium ajazii]
MTKKILILFLLSINVLYCQDEDEQTIERAYIETFGKCFSQLEPLQETKSKTELKNISFCSLYQCIKFVDYEDYEEKIQKAILKRALEIAFLLYNQRTPVYLVSGMNSSEKAFQKNLNLNDDNNLVYISIAECVSSSSLEQIKEIVNTKTSKLIESKKSNKK